MGAAKNVGKEQERGYGYKCTSERGVGRVWDTDQGVGCWQG